MGKIKDKVFGLVVSKNVEDSLADSVKEGNQAKFYLAQNDVTNGIALDSVTKPDWYTNRNVLIINGNKIQGVNQNDLDKLDAITDATKLFKYKGSVDTFDDLPTGVNHDVSVGDVWNIKRSFTLEDVSYPAYTNVVCVVAAYGSAPMIEWDSLGGTMQIGATARQKIVQDEIIYDTTDGIPINKFSIKAGMGLKWDYNGYNYALHLQISTKKGLEIDNNNDLYLKLATKVSIVHSVYGNDTSTSGLIFDDETGQLGIAIATSKGANVDIIEGAIKLTTAVYDTNGPAYLGGLYLSSLVMEDFITDHIISNLSIKGYINSLIDAKLKAQ